MTADDSVPALIPPADRQLPTTANCEPTCKQEEKTMLGLRRPPTMADNRSPLGRPAAGRPLRPGGERLGARRLGAPAFAALVLVLAALLSAWAPWRESRSASVSDYSPRVLSSPASVAASPTAAAAGTTPAASVAQAATPTAAATATTTTTPVAANPRPVGLPVQRNDWIIVRDYVAHGGPGPNGAIDVGIMGNREAVGTPIHATHDGTVRVLRNNKLYGNLVAVKNARWSTTYGHLDQIMVSDGQAVRRGDIIGTMGATGRATAPHVDYQVWEKVDNRELNRNPIDFIAPR